MRPEHRDRHLQPLPLARVRRLLCEHAARLLEKAELPALYASLGVKLSEHVPASMILHFWKFVLRPATTDLGRDVGAIESFLEGHGDRVKELQDALAKAGGNQGPIATGLGPLLGTVRSLDLLHGFVLALPVSVDFLGIYARRAREAIEEARVVNDAS